MMRMIKKLIGADKEKAKINVARLKKGKDTFEVVIDPDSAILFREGKLENVSDALKSENIFDDAKRGLKSNETRFKTIFGTEDNLEIAKKIILNGEIQLSESYRKELEEIKRKKIIGLISANAIDPTTKRPHPVTRIENAIVEAKIRIDANKSAEAQIQTIVSKLKPIIPIKFETRKATVRIPARFVNRSFSRIKNFGTISKQEKKSDGSLYFVMELPAGMVDDFMDILNKESKGSVEIKIESIR